MDFLNYFLWVFIMDFAYKVMKKFTGNIGKVTKNFVYGDIVSFKDASEWKNLDMLISTGYIKQITLDVKSDKPESTKVF